MKKLLLIAITIMLAAAQANAQKIGERESLNYRVMFKWGLVNKQAGHANLTTHPGSNGRFTSVLSATSERWADHIYRVRDTLRGSIDATTFEPSSYEKISHEGGEYKHDIISYHRSDDSVTATCRRERRKKKDAPLKTSEISLEATGLTLDMLSSFYYMRAIDYPAMKPGDAVEMNVFSGKRKELLTITYRGRQSIDIDGQQCPCYHITFRFTGNGGKKTSDDMAAWISEDNRVPLKLEGKLPVGKVQCYFTGYGR